MIDKGKKYYFIEHNVGHDSYVVRFGTLKSIVPKYVPQEMRSAKSDEEKYYIFRVSNGASDRNVSITHAEFIFETLEDVIVYAHKCYETNEYWDRVLTFAIDVIDNIK